MFAVFPSDLRPSAANAVRPTGYASDVPLAPPSTRPATSSAPAPSISYRTVGTLRYPAALPTSGINPTIVEGRPTSRLVGFTAPPLPSRSTEPITAIRQPLGIRTLSDIEPASSTAASGRKKRSTASQQQKPPVAVPSLIPLPGGSTAARQRQTVDRVAFAFSQPAANTDESASLPKIILLDDVVAFDKWLKDQSALHHWRKQDSVDLAEDAERKRKDYAQKPKNPSGKRRGPYKKREQKNKARVRVTYLCDHARRPEKGQGEGQTRFLTKESIKVGCEAHFVVHELEDKTVRVQIDARHTNHDPRTGESMDASRMPVSVREWIDARVEEGLTPQAIHEHIMISEATMEEYELCDVEDSTSLGQLPMLYSFRVNMDYIRARVRWFNEVKRRPRGPNGEPLSDIEASGVVLQQNIDKGGWSFTAIAQTPEGDVDVVAFASRWQLEILRKYGATLMMDATHNVVKGFSGKSLYLYTLVVKNKATQRGTPVAFMMTSSASQYPVGLLLSELFTAEKAPAKGHSPETLLIDCSRAEQAGIVWALPQTKVLYCHYHFWKAVNGNLDRRVGKGMPNSPLRAQRDAAVSLIRRMVRSTTEAEFNAAWQEAQQQWNNQGPKWKDFLNYFVTQWHYQTDEWAGYARRYEHSGIDTNNYLESWHQKLKRNYIKKRNLNMPEVIAMLLHEILPMFRFAHLRITLKFARASLTAAERKNRHSAMHYSNTDMALCVNIQEREHKIHVRSMQQPSIYYEIPYEDQSGAMGLGVRG